jgi:broad specificity phosphatase PhoE
MNEISMGPVDVAPDVVDVLPPVARDPGVLTQRVYLVRHGETDWSISGRHTGITDIPLTENGRWTAKRLAPALAAQRFSLVLTSPLLRARTTCELAGLGALAASERDLLEWHYGEYEGLTPAQIRSRAPEWMLFRDVAVPARKVPSRLAHEWIG